MSCFIFNLLSSVRTGDIYCVCVFKDAGNSYCSCTCKASSPWLKGFLILSLTDFPVQFLGEESLLLVPVFCAKSSGCRKSQNYKQKQSISRHDAQGTKASTAPVSYYLVFADDILNEFKITQIKILRNSFLHH
jgi:hypothetical protein